MNKEITKAINKQNKKHPIHKWWIKNSYKIWRIILFPFWIIKIISEKINNKLNEYEKWNETRTKEILNYYIPRNSNWNDNKKTFYFFDNGCGWYLKLAKKHLKRKDYRYWALYSYYCGGEIRNYLINDFVLEGFSKELKDCSGGWTEILFTQIEK